jgi:L-ascorbate metabolism protein UlaG (beta-lactamase superfamily)
MQWLGWSHFRFTSPTGKIVLTNPFVANPDSPVRLEDMTQADLIVVADGHGDEVGSAIEIAMQTGARLISPSFELGTWFMDRGVPAEQVSRVSPGARVRSGDITVRVVNSVHGSGLGQNRTDNVVYGGPAAGFVITFENGWTAYFSGSTAAHQDQALIAEMYRPHLVILPLEGSREPMDFAMQAKLLSTGNPNLSTVFPHHHRFVQQAGQTTIEEAQAAMNAMGISLTITEPFPGVEYEFPA